MDDGDPFYILWMFFLHVLYLVARVFGTILFSVISVAIMATVVYFLKWAMTHAKTVAWIARNLWALVWAATAGVKATVSAPFRFLFRGRVSFGLGFVRPLAHPDSPLPGGWPRDRSIILGRPTGARPQILMIELLRDVCHCIWLVSSKTGGVVRALGSWLLRSRERPLRLHKAKIAENTLDDKQLERLSQLKEELR